MTSWNDAIPKITRELLAELYTAVQGDVSPLTAVEDNNEDAASVIERLARELRSAEVTLSQIRDEICHAALTASIDLASLAEWFSLPSQQLRFEIDEYRKDVIDKIRGS